MLGHGAFWLVTDGVGHDETMSISYLIVRSFSTRRTGDFYHTVRQEFVDSACLVAVGVKYHSDDGGSPAPTKNVVKLLQYLGDIGLGYSNIALSPITTDKVRDMIFVKKLPFYYSGKSSTNSHAWVLDGWLLRERRVITRYAFLPTQYHTESKEFVHANFGWGGQKDRYYTFNAFYTDRGPVSPQSIEDRDYDHDFSAVTYNLSK